MGEVVQFPVPVVESVGFRDQERRRFEMFRRLGARRRVKIGAEQVEGREPTIEHDDEKRPVA